MSSANDKSKVHREKLRAAGFKRVQIWVPDPSAPGFAAECQRQSRMADNDPANLDDLLAFAEIADFFPPD